MMAGMELSAYAPGRLVGVAVLLAALYMLQPGAYLAGNWDPGVYLGVGAATARHPVSFRFPDAATEVLTVTQTAMLYPEQHGITIKTPGFFSPGPPFGYLVPQFLPAYPRLLGAAFTAGGLPAALRLDALLIAWSVVIFARWAERRAGSPVAFWSTVALLGLHPVTFWFARFHTAESLALLLSALWVASLFGASTMSPASTLRRIGSYAPPWLLCWTTPATWPVVLGSALLAFAPGQTTRHRIAIALTAIGGPASIALSLLALDHPYADHLRRVTPDPPGLLWIGLLITAGMSLSALVVRFALPTRPTAPRTRHPGTMAIILAAVAALSILTPSLAPPFADGLFVLTPVALWLVALPAFVSPTPRERFHLLWLLAITVAISLLFILAPAMPALYPWTWKRWMWWTLPVLSAAAAMTIATQSARATPTFRLRILAPAASTAALVLLPWVWCAPLATTTAWQGLPDWMDHLAAALPREAIVLTDKSLAAPLEFLHGRTVVPLYADDHTERAPYYQQLLAEHPDRTFALVTSLAPPAWWPGTAAQPVFITPYEGHWIKPQPQPRHFTVETRRFDPSVYLLVPATAP